MIFSKTLGRDRSSREPVGIRARVFASALAAGSVPCAKARWHCTKFKEVGTKEVGLGSPRAVFKETSTVSSTRRLQEGSMVPFTEPR